jgi:LysR family transcriptional regulator, cyn operon transcriptional activator
MELRHLRYFLAIVGTSHMAKAAEQMFVTQSTLSHQLAQLEQELGVALFERVGRGLRLSVAGEQWAHVAREILDKVELGKEQLRGHARDVSGDLRIGVIHSYMTHLIAQVTSPLIERFPKLRLRVHELTALEIEAQVATGQLDVGLAFFPSTSAAVEATLLFDDQLVMAVHPTHALGHRSSIRLAQLQDYPMALMSPRFATRRLLDACFQQAGLRANVVLELDSIEALRLIAQDGKLLTFLPRRTTRSSAHLRLVKITEPQPTRAAGLIFRRTEYRSPAVQAFEAQLRTAISRQH